MAIRLETKHSMLRRCRGWDYRRPCIYQITLVLADRKSKALGRLVIDRELPCQAQDRSLGLVSATAAPGLEAAASSYIALTPARRSRASF